MRLTIYLAFLAVLSVWAWNPTVVSAADGPFINEGPLATGPSMRPPQAPVQKPPPGLGQKMEEMLKAADRIIARAKKGPHEPAAFRQAALEIFGVMRPRFGPANAWLFNERGRKLEELAQALGLGTEAFKLIDQDLFEAACLDLEALVALTAQLGYDSKVRGADRSELLWDPSPGFALSVTDTSRTVTWSPPYANTPAGPEATPQKMNPRATLFVYPPYRGRTVRHLFTRHQPGEPVFYTGSLVGYILQEPQSLDVEPEGILEAILARLKSSGMIYQPPEEAPEILRRTLKRNIGEVRTRNGISLVKADFDFPEIEIKGLGGAALLWITTSGSTEILNLRFLK